MAEILSDFSGHVLDGLRNLREEPDSKAVIVPETRLADADEAQALVRRAVYADQIRDTKRAKVQGLIDGNAPYDRERLISANRADACNVNWGVPRSYLGTAIDAFYDIVDGAETYCVVELDLPDEQRTEKSRIATEEFDKLQKSDRAWDSVIQISQREMVLFGTGPMIFEDGVDWRCKNCLHRNLLVPENQSSDIDEWELGTIRKAYLPHKLYEFIRDEKAAEAIGWNVEAVKQAIMAAHPATQQQGNYLNWEWHQQQLKNASYYYSAQSKKIFCAHIYFKEFPKEDQDDGRISHVIVLEVYGQENQNAANMFLFQSIGRFKEWRECVHPMYYNHGSGGEHHAVEGMGIKMYSAMEFQNRLLCNLADKAFAPKIIFKPTTPNGEQVASITNLGEYGSIPSGFDAVQMPVNALMNDGLLMNREIKGMVASNLSQYRQDIQDSSDKPGNPPTAHQVMQNASEQAKLGNTQLNRYFKQLDFLYAEKYRRAANPNLTREMPGGKMALDFQEACEKRGVTRSDLVKVSFVKASRVAGQGSQFMRQQMLQQLLGMVQMLPETGRDNLIRDVIASKVGQHFVRRYYPSSPAMQKPTEQNERALDQVAAMKVGIPPVVVSSQNAIIFAQTFLQAAAQAFQSLQQGASAPDVLHFMQQCGPGIAAQLQRIANDPTRKAAYTALEKQYQQVVQMTDQLKQQVQAAIQKQQKQQQIQQQKMAEAQQQNGDPVARGELQIHAAQAQHDMQLNGARRNQEMQIHGAKSAQELQLERTRTAQDLALQSEAHRQKIALEDARTAAEIRRKDAESAAAVSAAKSKEPNQ